MKKEKFTVRCTGLSQPVHVEGERFFFSNWLKANKFFESKKTEQTPLDEGTIYSPEPVGDGRYSVEIVYFDRLVWND